MKQLSQCCGKWLLVALGERAFLVQIESEQVIELLPAVASTVTSENPIQAVALTEETDIIWCAVTTLDKKLALYRVNPKSSNETNSTTQAPTTIHTTIKRVGCVCFARVSDAPLIDENEKTISSSQGILVCITGGLTGDAWAFSLEEAGKKRLLLGHTASMLTGVKVQGNFLLTSDRDEKIRVTCFPDSSIIRGFLLGHEAYISAMDVANTQKHHICVSCSGGDNTVRIWDYESLRLLCTWRAEKKDTDDPRIPSRVAIKPDGSLVGVIYDKCNVLDILTVESEGDAKQKVLRHSQSIQCIAQPLAVTFIGEYIVVLLRDPAYLQAYRPTQGSKEKEHSSSWELIELAGCAALQKVAMEATIPMPDSVLEKDKHGQATMSKLNETRGNNRPVDQMPWNKSDRRDIAKERNKRHKRRRQHRKGE